MPLRIACDLDGTLADMERDLQRLAKTLFGADVDLRAGSGLPLAPLQSPAHFGDDDETNEPANAEPPADELEVRTGRPLTDRERRKLWAHVGSISGFWRGLSEIEPGSVRQLAERADAHRWEVLFVTQRPEGAGTTPQRQSHEWLRAHGFECPSIFVLQGSRGRLADALALDVVIDDRPDNCLDVVSESTAKAILVWRDEPGTAPPGVQRPGISVVSSFAEALDQLETIMANRQKSGGLFGRIRDAFGM